MDQGCLQRGNILSNGLEHVLEVNGAILVGGDIAKAANGLPWDIRHGSEIAVRERFGQFADIDQPQPRLRYRPLTRKEITPHNRPAPKSLALIPSPATIDGRTVFGHPICKRLLRNAIIAAS